MARVITDPFSQVPIFVKMKFGTTELSTATAFFYSRADALYLVSNWHVFSGRNPDSKRPLSAHGGVPDVVSCYACLNDRIIKREWLDIPLRTR